MARRPLVKKKLAKVDTRAGASKDFQIVIRVPLAWVEFADAAAARFEAQHGVRVTRSEMMRRFLADGIRRAQEGS